MGMLKGVIVVGLILKTEEGVAFFFDRGENTYLILVVVTLIITREIIRILFRV